MKNAPIFFRRRSLDAAWIAVTSESLTTPIHEIDKISIASVAHFFDRIRPSSSSSSRLVLYHEDFIKDRVADAREALQKFASLVLHRVVSKTTIGEDAPLFRRAMIYWDDSEFLLSMIGVAEDRVHRWNYLRRNRQCARHVTFPMLQEEYLHREKTRQCPFAGGIDCEFSGIFTLNQREELYDEDGVDAMRCGFLISTVFDEVRRRIF